MPKPKRQEHEDDAKSGPQSGSEDSRGQGIPREISEGSDPLSRLAEGHRPKWGKSEREASEQVEFINRERELELFRKIMSGEIPERIITIQADTGMGKTSLLRYFLHMANEAGIASALVDFDSSRDLFETLQLLSASLGIHGVPELLEAKTGKPVDMSVENEAYAVATIKDIQSGTPLIIGCPYHLEAAVMTAPVVETRGELELPELAEPIGFKIIVHAEDMMTSPSQSKLFVLPCNQSNTPLAEFLIIPKSVGKKRIIVDYFYQNHLLQTVTLNIEVIKSEDMPGQREVLSVKGLSKPIGSLVPHLGQHIISNHFIENLRMLCRTQKVALFFDSLERASNEISTWIQSTLMASIASIVTSAFPNAIVALSGRSLPPMPSAMEHSIVRMQLEGFDIETVKEYFKMSRLELTPKELDHLSQMSQGQPLLLASIVDALRRAG